MYINHKDIEDLALGATVLGAGGGGDPYITRLLAQKIIQKYGPVQLLQPFMVPDEALIIPTAFMGATTVLQEKLLNGKEAYGALKMLESYLRTRTFATMPAEAGGLNAIIPFMVAARAGIPVIDSDGMGRALPEHQMSSFHVYGISGSPMVINTEQDDYILLKVKDNYRLAEIARSLLASTGGIGNMAGYVMTGEQMKETAITGTVSFGLKLGTAIRKAIQEKGDTFEAISQVTSNSTYGRAIKLFQGKITDIERRLNNSYLRGRAVIRGIRDFSGSECIIEFQNENIIALIDNETAALVPDIITYLDAETGFPLSIEQLKYGYRVTVIGIPTPEIMRTERALQVWGPRKFGYDIDYIPLEVLEKFRAIQRANKGFLEKGGAQG